jgi:hypothetical protein
MSTRTWVPFAVSAATGLAYWAAVVAMLGRREPWDGPGYWTLAYPVALALSAVLALAFPKGGWRWALVVMLSQMVVMAAGGAGLSMAPLGVALLAILALPGVGLGLVIERLRNR